MGPDDIACFCDDFFPIESFFEQFVFGDLFEVVVNEFFIGLLNCIGLSVLVKDGLSDLGFDELFCFFTVVNFELEFGFLIACLVDTLVSFF